MNIEESITAAISYHRSGALTEALRLYQGILEVQSDHALVLQLLGWLHYQEKRYDEAISCYRRFLLNNTGNAEIFNNLGNIYFDLKEMGEAIACYQKALQFDGENAEIYNNLGIAFKEEGLFEQSELCYRRAIGLMPDYAEAHFNLGNVLRDKGELEEAVACYRIALKIKPSINKACCNPEAIYQEQGNINDIVDEDIDREREYFLLGTAYRQRKNYKNAVENFRKAIAVNPRSAESYNELGLTLQDSGDIKEAIDCFRQLADIAPYSPESFNNLGNALQYAGDIPGAVENFNKALLLKPEAAEIHFNLSQSLLLSGNFADGWREYEWRKKLGEVSSAHKRRNREWGGEEINGKTILLYAEQGLGDAIQFMRYSSLVADSGARVVLECPQVLVSTGSKVKGHDLVIAPGREFAEYDVYCSLLSLPYLFGTEMKSIPDDIPYIHADAELIDEWHKRICGHGDRLKVGIVWAGKPAHARDHMRSFSVEMYKSLFDMKNIKFYSLQKGGASQEIKGNKWKNVVEDYSEKLHDFSDTAALIENLDLVISVDTAVAHLAGAMGKPVWTLLPYAADWRWLLGREDSPWYPTMRLFRQPALGDWESVIARVAESLAEYTAS